MNDARARIVFVEDDAAVRRFVVMALEPLEVELVECANVAQALDALSAAPARVVMTDLMMPGDSGFSLLTHLTETPALLGEARIVVFSAITDQATRRRLEQFNVWRILPKPTSLAALEECIGDALTANGTQSATQPPLEAVDIHADEADAVARHFGGNAKLYDSFKQTCLDQFPFDAQAGDEACRAADGQALRRVTHSLKSVLTLLGYPELSAQAAAIEQSSSHGELSAAILAWPHLRDKIMLLRRPR